MSRIGINPVAIPAGVEITRSGAALTARGRHGELSVEIPDYVEAAEENSSLVIRPLRKTKAARQAWGTTRALLQNAVTGVSDGFTRRLEVNGVGYRARLEGANLVLNLGFSHDVVYPVPEDVKITVEGDRGNVVAIFGASKQRVGQVASDIRRFRPPEPYKGKGVKYAEEILLRKEGKKK